MLDYLFHIMQLEFPKLMGGKKYQTVITVFDETSGEYYAKDYLFKPAEVTASADKFYLSMPNGLTEGTWDDMHLYIDERPPAFFVTFDLFAIMR